ncbi:hypothetical protein [Paracoccus sp. SCSIO 75233]|uniref:hypothetical protein n=1 Tax=Paracoccus sp. SCSIO 75233 TaxID=3017782 RepID=UPI0022F0A5FE|nr:hypothetical protein [Paracoccus sp. SCSIO 75233]WBU52709.1 hypothetical protein PAF12_12920 [Paracoccus sp. SCSIO 75233]
MRSRLVAWLRVALPLAALAILSTLFLFGSKPDPDNAIPYAEVDAEELARDPRMTRPQFSGVTDSGSEITLTASRATPGSTERAEAESLRLTYRAPDGIAADLTAPRAQVEDTLIRLEGGVYMTTSDGWALTMPSIDTDLEAGRLEGGNGLTAFAPMGRLDADKLSVERNADGEHVLNLTGNVRLIYEP